MITIAITGVIIYSFGASPASGPLKVHPANPRYFTDGSGKAVYLTGSHTWNNLKDMGRTDPPSEFDFQAYLDFMEKYNHNFIRLWTWELSKYSYKDITHAQPFPWMRTGPGNTMDGKPKFHLDKLDNDYFQRLRDRVTAAGKRGIYVSIMLFEGHGLHASEKPWCWDGHPFNVNNNVNDIDGDPDKDGRGLETQTLQIPEITKIQETYVSKVIDTVNDLDNVLYEIVNESGNYSTEWQYHIIDFIHKYEKDKPKQHPVGMTFQFCRTAEFKGKNEDLFASPAEWISPNPDGGYRDNPPAADGSKVILNDTDHLWGIGGNQAWVWKSFCRGMNPLFMDPYHRKTNDEGTSSWTDHLSGSPELDPVWEPIRKSLGYTSKYAERMDLTNTKPMDDLASSGYCLANPGVEYLVFIPENGKVEVNLMDAKGDLIIEWFNPTTGEILQRQKISGGQKISLDVLFDDAVLYITGEK
ncbi:hypothetical protein GF312_12165 [Candidatus Poribacteria bacterium]|nr:hypothetical protein [Candidatus Poribacteria bacterium]